MNHHYNMINGPEQPAYSFPINPPLFTYCEENLDFDFSSLFDDDKELFITASQLPMVGLSSFAANQSASAAAAANAANAAIASGPNPNNMSSYLASHVGTFMPASVIGNSYMMQPDVSDDEYSSSDDCAGDKKRKVGEPKLKTQEQIVRRREKNRILAKKTRQRKKFFFESLQQEVVKLTAENDVLKNIVREKMSSEIKRKVLSQCKTETNSTSMSIVSTSKAKATSFLDSTDFSLIAAIQAAQRSFVITDPLLPDNPIVYASQGFLELSGYSMEEVVGRNCRFMQGPKTDQAQVMHLRKGIYEGADTSCCLLNYRKDGTTFYNQIFIAALRDVNMKIVNYVGVQLEVKVNPHEYPMEGATNASVSNILIPRPASSSDLIAAAALASSVSQSQLTMKMMGSGSNDKKTSKRVPRKVASGVNLKELNDVASEQAAMLSHNRSYDNFGNTDAATSGQGSNVIQNMGMGYSDGSDVHSLNGLQSFYT